MQYESKLASEQADKLFSAILTLESREECYRFFEDLCTIKELHDLAQRFEVAKKLKDGVTYQEIAQKTGASTATISRVNRCLHYGAGGYQLALERLKDREDKL
mgnify:CR=1 FL=1